MCEGNSEEKVKLRKEASVNVQTKIKIETIKEGKK